MADQEMAEVEFASRLTLKDLGADGPAVKKMLKDGPETQTKFPVARFYGTVSRVAFQNDKMGTGQVYTQFIGNFEGVNLTTGEVLASARMYLPDGAAQVLENRVSEFQKKNKSATVQFAFEIRAVRSAGNKVGYAYETVAILKPEEADPIAAVRQVVASAPVPKAGGEKPKANDAKKPAA